MISKKRVEEAKCRIALGDVVALATLVPVVGSGQTGLRN
jgi:hypothetical protein